MSMSGIKAASESEDSARLLCGHPWFANFIGSSFSLEILDAYFISGILSLVWFQAILRHVTWEVWKVFWRAFSDPPCIIWWSHIWPLICMLSNWENHKIYWIREKQNFQRWRQAVFSNYYRFLGEIAYVG